MNKPIINITKNAFTKMETIMKKSWNKNGFLFGVTSGGCNGFNFNLKLIENKELDEIKKLKPNIISQGDVNVFVEPLSEIYLIGTTIDYTEENFSKGIFESKFIYNIDKELATSCGCGISFNPRKL
tara:strand:+ start:8825 stop:9202 length:378 start_codon:yes stop_codon:yes gene_type:complete